MTPHTQRIDDCGHLREVEQHPAPLDYERFDHAPEPTPEEELRKLVDWCKGMALSLDNLAHDMRVYPSTMDAQFVEQRAAEIRDRLEEVTCT